MSFPRYPAYKPSGVEWLGEVPEHWQVKPLKRVADIQTGLAKGKEVETEGSVEVPFLRVANVQDGFLDLENVHTITISESSLNRYLLRPGDVLMNEGGDFDKLGRGCIWDGTINPCIHQNHVFAVRPHSIRPSWLNVYTSSAQANSYFISRSKQSTNLASISSSNLMDLLVPIAPDSETEEILDFLNRETAKIDALIAEQQRLIELLQEKRQAVISHAVTKGLNQDAPMKDSGVEWLGEVPEHWEVKRLKDISSVIDCRNKTPEYVDEGQYLVVRTTNIKERKLVLDDARYTDERNFKIWTQRGIPRAGSIFFTREAPAGETAVVPEGVPLCMGQRMMNIDASSETLTRYILCFLQSSCLKRYIEACSMGSIVGHLRVPQVENLPLTVPPAGEQKLIARRVAELDATFDEATSCLNASVNLLHERRSTLISAAVTGQIDVRGLMPEVEAA